MQVPCATESVYKWTYRKTLRNIWKRLHSVIEWLWVKDTMLSIKRYGRFKIKSALSNTIHVIALFGARLTLGEFQCKTSYFKAQQHERRMIRNISRSVVSATVIILSNILLWAQPHRYKQNYSLAFNTLLSRYG